MDHGDNKHCLEEPWCDIYHYKEIGGNHHACGVQDSPTRVEIFPHSRKYPSLAFEIPRQRYELSKVQDMMEHAYKQGQNDQKRVIGKMMRDLIAL